MDNTTKYKVNLFVPGAGKSGTSSLHSYLNQHPEICMSQNKEPAYFAVDANYAKGASYYNSLFECDSRKKPIYFGESSTIYFLSHSAIARIKREIPDPRFIFILRNPIDRIFSHFYWISNRMGEKVLPFEEEILADKDESLDPNKPLESGAYKYYIQESNYGSAIEAYIKAFGEESTFIITTEQLKKDPLDTLNKCFNFLKLPLIKSIEQKLINVTPPATHHTTPFFLKKLSVIFPDIIFRRLKNTILSSFFTKYDYIPLITPAQRIWLKGLLEAEINKLKFITGREYVEWTDFN